MTIAGPKISIIVPIYNVERYLRQCIDSLLNQTLRDIEIICVDDGSTDTSPTILADLATRDPRIRTSRHERNRGLSAARNTGLTLARAPYIMFCDSDDWYESSACESMLGAIQSASGIDYAVCATRIHYEHEKHLSRSDAKYYRVKHSGLVDVDDAVRLSTNVSVCNKIFRRSLIESYNIRFPEGLRYEDTAFYHIYSLSSKRAVYLPKVFLYHYRRRTASIMSNTFDGNLHSATDMLRVAEVIYEFMVAQNYLPSQSRYYKMLYFGLLTSALSFERNDAAKREIMKHADKFLTRTGLECEDDAELRYRRTLLTHRIIPGTQRKRCCGLITTKYKAHGAKHYFLGIPLLTTYHLPA